MPFRRVPQGLRAPQGPGGRDGARPHGVVAGVCVALAVLIGGLAFVVMSPTRWAAAGSVVVLPRADVDPAQLAGYYETLSRGQMVATFAEVLRLRQFDVNAGRELGLGDRERQEVDVAVQVVPDTAVITVTATATDRKVAESFVDSILGQATDYIRVLPQPYAAQVLGSAKGTARSHGLPKAAFAAVVVVVAAAGGLFTQQVLQWLWWARGRTLQTRFDQPVYDPDGVGIGAEPHRRHGFSNRADGTGAPESSSAPGSPGSAKPWGVFRR